MTAPVPMPGDSVPQAKTFRAGSLIYSKKGLFILFAGMLWGDFCFTFMEAVVPSILPLKLWSLGSANVLVGFVMTTLPGIFNFTITPWLSFNSDRHRSNWGRRRPITASTGGWWEWWRSPYSVICSPWRPGWVTTLGMNRTGIMPLSSASPLFSTWCSLDFTS